MPRILPLCALLVTALLAAASPVAAHAPVPPAVVFTPPTLNETLTAAPVPALPWAALAVIATVALVGAWHPRRAFALSLVLVVGVLAFEAGLHSTHHLGQADESRCVVAGVAAQLSADLVATAFDAPPAPVLETAVTVPAPLPVAARIVAPHAGRAPPAFSA
jgi:hypothetical protein